MPWLPSCLVNSRVRRARADAPASVSSFEANAADRFRVPRCFRMESWINSLRQSVTPQRPRVRTKGRLCRPSLKTPSRPLLRTHARVSRSPVTRRDRTPPFVSRRACQPTARTPRVDTARRKSNRRRWTPPQVVLPGDATDPPEHNISRCLRSSSRIRAANGRNLSVESGATSLKLVQQSVSSPIAITFKNKNLDLELIEALCKADLKAMLNALPKTTGPSMEAALMAATQRAQPALVAALWRRAQTPRRRPRARPTRSGPPGRRWGTTPLADGAGVRCADVLLRAGAYVDVTTRRADAAAYGRAARLRRLRAAAAQRRPRTSALWTRPGARRRITEARLRPGRSTPSSAGPTSN
ncbi:Protein of unknown function [Gryllus bimaculatus]|nr:Protein of unknown function [Gryllus bimaculatus]